MSPRRRYTAHQKVTAVMAAEFVNAEKASEETGIPRSTIRRWIDLPEYAELRQKTRDDLADEARVIQQMAAAQIRKRLPEFEPRDLTILYGVMADKGQLLGGQATSRTETRTLMDGMDDHEREALRRVIDDVLGKVPA